MFAHKGGVYIILPPPIFLSLNLCNTVKGKEYYKEESGTYFDCYIFGDTCVKIAKDEKLGKIDMKKIASLYKRMEGLEYVIPAEIVDDRTMIQPRAKGKSVREWNDDSITKKYRKFRAKIQAEIGALGIKAMDLSRNNVFYDKETDSFSLIDINVFDTVQSIRAQFDR